MVQLLGIPVNSSDLLLQGEAGVGHRPQLVLSSLRMLLAICAFRPLIPFVLLTRLSPTRATVGCAKLRVNRPMQAPYLRHLRLQLSM